MSYYQPKFPRGKLHQIVTKYIADMRQLGREPNCAVAFGDPDRADVRGWLLKDPRPSSARNRYVLVGDGDVWREVETPVSVPADASGAPLPPSRRTWLNGLDDDFVTLLHHSLATARTGGDGCLEREESIELPHVVDDRREHQEPHVGPERRRR
jgi:hypothetical protein